MKEFNLPWLVLKMKEITMSQQMWQPLDAGKDREIVSNS
jgi:hypothetical protein